MFSRLIVNKIVSGSLALATVLICAVAPVMALDSGSLKETTMPSKYVEVIAPEMAGKYIFSSDGEFAQACGLPCYQWMPATAPLKKIIIGVHGLTLHGRRYRVMARTLAVNGVGFISMDMYGFGRNRFNEDGSEKPKSQDTAIRHQRSYEAIVKLLKAVKEKYPNLEVLMLGESLGCTFCLKAATDYPELVKGVILSAPAVKVNPKMYGSPSDIMSGLKAIFSLSTRVDLKNFLTSLVSNRKEVVDEMLEDPFILKNLSFRDLIATDAFVGRTVKWSKNSSPDLSVFVLQGSSDNCVVPDKLTDLLMSLRSCDIRIAWKGRFGHLQFETAYMRASVVDSLTMWMQDHGKDIKPKLEQIQETISRVGGILVP